MKKKIVAIVPIKKKSKRVPGKNFIKINGTPLYQILLKKLKKCNFDKIYVDSDSEIVRKFCIKNGFFFIKRLPHLAKDNANGNDLLNYHQKIIKADFYFQIFITAPLLSIKSINRCISLLKKKKNDSIMTVNEIYSWFWFKNKPINYQPKVLPRSQDAKPIIQETTGLYGITQKALIKYKCRIGKKPIFFKVPNHEALDLDNIEDFVTLKKYAKRYLFY
jgi:CMP-N-acetylneuraminic acid synthetase